MLNVRELPGSQVSGGNMENGGSISVVTKSTSIRFLVIGFVFALVLSAVGCSSASKDQGTSVNVNMTSYAFQLDKESVPAGPVTFHVKNAAQCTPIIITGNNSR